MGWSSFFFFGGGGGKAKQIKQKKKEKKRSIFGSDFVWGETRAAVPLGGEMENGYFDVFFCCVVKTFV